MTQSKGEVNDSFIVGVKNLDTFFWKIVVKSIERSQKDGEVMEEILGLSVRITQKELEQFIQSRKEAGDSDMNTEETE